MQNATKRSPTSVLRRERNGVLHRYAGQSNRAFMFYNILAHPIFCMYSEWRVGRMVGLGHLQLYVRCRPPETGQELRQPLADQQWSLLQR